MLSGCASTIDTHQARSPKYMIPSKPSISSIDASMQAIDGAMTYACLVRTTRVAVLHLCKATFKASRFSPDTRHVIL